MNNLLNYILDSKDEIIILSYKDILKDKLIEEKLINHDKNEIYESINSSVLLLRQSNILIFDNDIKNGIVVFKKIK